MVPNERYDQHLALLDTAVVLAQPDTEPQPTRGVLILALAVYEAIAAEREAYLESLAAARPGAAGIGTWMQLLARGLGASNSLSASESDEDRWLEERFGRAVSILASTNTQVLSGTLGS